MAQQATLTDGDTVRVDAEPATNRQSDAGGPSGEPQLARARDDQRTPSGNALPDTERVGDALMDWLHGLQDLALRIWDGSFWDEQPPSPRELVQRYQESPWTHSEYRLLRILRWAGCAFSIVWSLPLYGLAILSHRFGRALPAVLLTYLLFNLL